MPHVIVKLWPGKTDQRKHALSDAISQAVMTHLGYGDDAVLVGFDEIGPDVWADQVVKPDILDKWPSLLKQPGYVDGGSDARRPVPPPS